MKLADFNDLCHREYANDRGIVTRLALSPQDCTELSADIVGDDIAGTIQPEGAAGVLTGGAIVAQIINPATVDGPGRPVPVIIDVVALDGFAGSAEVTRWVEIAP